MICSTCGAENKPGRRFCLECAAPLEIICPSCGAANEPVAKFCGSCASPLAAPGPEPATAVDPAVAERRLVSVLFADLVGFTPYAEKRDAEDVRDTLDRYFARASEVIGRYGGTVEKFIGDAVMAVWGAPTAHEDDAERAVRAGLELIDAVRQLGPGIRARAGVITGEAAVTVGATNQGLVAGDIVNTASRLQGAAQPGTVLVGEATQRAAGKAIVFEAAGDQALKGKDAPVAAWRALRVVAERGGRNRSDTLEAPFVGRDDELRLLKDLFHATTREGRARLVSVIGPAGIGKTRLAWEFLKYVDGLVEPVWWHDGRSPAYGDGIEDSRWGGAERLIETQVLALEGRLGQAYDAAMQGARVTSYDFPNSLWAARLGLWLGDRKRARVALEINLALPLRGRFVQANRRSLEAGVMALGGDTDGALAAYRESERLHRALDMPFPLSMTLMEAGTLLDPAIPAVAAAAVEARAIMERLGSPPLLARLDAMQEAQAARFGGPRPSGSGAASDRAAQEASSPRP